MFLAGHTIGLMYLIGLIQAPLMFWSFLQIMLKFVFSEFELQFLFDPTLFLKSKRCVMFLEVWWSCLLFESS